MTLMEGQVIRLKRRKVSGSALMKRKTSITSGPKMTLENRAFLSAILSTNRPGAAHTSREP